MRYPESMRYVALLRGINVGGHSRLTMPDLRALLSSLGFSAVATYIQSGNALFAASLRDPAVLAGQIEEGIAADLGMTVRVLVRSQDELAAVVAGNPFGGETIKRSQLHAAFLSGPVDPGRLAAVDSAQFAPDAFHPGDRVLYLHYPNGAYRSKLTNVFWERRLGLDATLRNWNTVTTLLEMLDR